MSHWPQASRRTHARRERQQRQLEGLQKKRRMNGVSCNAQRRQKPKSKRERNRTIKMSHRPEPSHGTRASRGCHERQVAGPQNKGEAWTAPTQEHEPLARVKPRDSCEQRLPKNGSSRARRTQKHEPQARVKARDSCEQSLPETAARGPAGKTKRNAVKEPRAPKGATRNSFSGPRLSLARAAALSAPSTELVAATRKSLDWRARTRSSVPTRNKHGEGFPHMLSPARVNQARCVRGTEWRFSDPSGHSRPRVEAHGRVRVARGKERSVVRFVTSADLALAGHQNPEVLKRQRKDDIPVVLEETAQQ